MKTYTGQIRIDVDDKGAGRLLVDYDAFQFCKDNGLVLAVHLRRPEESEPASQSQAGPAELERYRQEREAADSGEVKPEYGESMDKAMQKAKLERTRGRGRPERS